MAVYGLESLEWSGLLMLGLENKMLFMMSKQEVLTSQAQKHSLCTLPVSYRYLLLYYRNASQDS